MNQAKIIVKSLTQTCLAAPSSWEGHLGSKGFVYIKYRWGVLRAYQTATEEETIEKRSQIFEKRIGGRFDGYMVTRKMKTKLAGLLRFLGPTEMHEDWYALQRMRKIPPRGRRRQQEVRRERRGIMKSNADIRAGRTRPADDLLKQLRPQKPLRLSKRDQQVFAKALLHPPKPNTRLRKAFKHYKRTIGDRSHV